MVLPLPTGNLRFIALAALNICFAFTACAENPIGEQLYHDQCASCHGDLGQGIDAKYDKPLYGDLPVDALAKVISETMPEEKPAACVGEQAELVARYMIDTFYTQEARAKNRPPRIALSRLTVEQFDCAVTDLISGVDRLRQPKGEPGLKAEYFKSRSYNRSKRAFERVDPRVEFDFGEGSPGKEFDNEEFSMNWRGSIIAERTGQYEFIVRSHNGVKLSVNSDSDPLIDGWVSSGGEERELTATVRLLGGRAYPIKLEFFKYKDRLASVKLLWRPPGNPVSVIPSRNLRSVWTQPSFVASQALPPDDSSFGYPRGTSVSQAWHEATTRTAIEAADAVATRIDRLAKTKPDDGKRNEKIRRFCLQLVARAMRRPLTDEQKEFFVERHFRDAGNTDEAIRRCVLLTLKSPRFLYPLASFDEPNDYDAVSQISFGMWDSLPDRRLIADAAGGELNTNRNRFRAAIRRTIDDLRTRAKIHEFYNRWLMLDRAASMAKDGELYAGFSPELIADLQRSLEIFLDQVFWSDQSDFRHLILSDQLVVNGRVAEFYGIELDQEIDDETFKSVPAKQQHRSGVVTHPLVLAALAYQKETSPIHRGVFVTRKLLGRRLNPPSQATEFRESDFDPHMTMREKVSELTKSTQCQSCHRVINPLGFSLEHYDAVGRFRLVSHQQKQIDARSDYQDVTGKMIRLEGARDLAVHIAQSDAAQKGFIRQLFEHMIRQPPAAYGASTLDELHAQFVRNSFNVRELLIDIMVVATRAAKPTGS